MYFKLTLSFALLFPFCSWSQTNHELLSFSENKQWQRLLYYEAGNSLVGGDKYFISPQGAKDPLEELKSNINVFKHNLKNKKGLSYQCRFPARYKVLKERWPHEFKKTQECRELNEWLSGMDAGNLHLVYSSAYPNNPASMFGHTFLRFDRKSRSKSQSTNELLGYSVAFLARPDPSDGPITYTINGLFGGYYAGLEIKPYYINVGTYNNSESRDLWEYKIEISEDKKDLLLYHMWELSTSAAFTYKFLSENCSTMLVRLLEVVNLDWDLKSKNDFFVIPTETLKELVVVNKSKKFKARSSIMRKVIFQLEKMNGNQKNSFHNSRTQLLLPKEEDVLVMDTLIDYWKYFNYKEGTKLASKEKKHFIDVFDARAKLREITDFNQDLLNRSFENQNPIKGHKLGKVEILGGPDYSALSLRYGFHDFEDHVLGHDNKAYIDFLKINISTKKKSQTKIESFKLAEIYSLQDFSFKYPKLTWKGALATYNNIDNYTALESGFGISSVGEKSIFLSMIDIDFLSDNTRINTQISLGLESSYKYLISDVYSFAIKARIYQSLEKTFLKEISGKFFKITRLGDIVLKLASSDLGPSGLIGFRRYF